MPEWAVLALIAGVIAAGFWHLAARGAHRGERDIAVDHPECRLDHVAALSCRAAAILHTRRENGKNLVHMICNLV
jgi:hypothetical protein